MTIFIDRHGLIDGECLLDVQQQTLKYLYFSTSSDMYIYMHRQVALIKLLEIVEGLVGGFESNLLPVKHGGRYHAMQSDVMQCNAMQCNARFEPLIYFVNP
jgi:hypothetical protein